MSKQSGVAPKKLTKKEIQANKEEEARLRTLVKEVIYPILLKNAKNIKDAKNICRTVAVGMDAIFMQKVKEYQNFLTEDKLSVLKLNEQMNDSKDYPAEHALALAMENETVSCAKTLIEGMEAELNRLTDSELTNRSLDTLQTEWL